MKNIDAKWLKKKKVFPLWNSSVYLGTDIKERAPGQYCLRLSLICMLHVYTCTFNDVHQG